MAWRLWVLLRLAKGPLLEHLTADAWAYWSWSSELRTGISGARQAFFLGPLYPYWLAATRSLVGDSVASVAVVQCLLGAASVVLITDAIRRVASPRASLVTGVVLAIYPMAVLFNVLVVMETLVLFLEALLLWWLMRWSAANSTRSILACAFIVGLLTLGRATSAALLLPVLYVAWCHRGDSGRFAAHALLAVAVAACAIAPAAWHNRAATGEFIPVTYSAGYNFFVGNGPGANGTFREVVAGYDEVPLGGGAEGGTAGDGRYFFMRTTGTRMTPSESSRHWFGETMKHVRAEPWSVLRTAGRKLLFMLNRKELPQIESPSAYGRAAGSLGLPVDWAFAYFGVLGLAGVWWAWRMGGQARATVLWSVCLIAGIAAFFVVDRYRVHLVVPLAVLASVTIDRIQAWRPAYRPWSIVWGAAVLGVVCTPLIPSSKDHEEWAIASTMGEAWLARSRPDSALGYLQRAAAIDLEGRLPASGATDTRAIRGSTYLSLGMAYEQLGQFDLAIDNLRHGLDLVPEAESFRPRLALLLARHQEPKAAAEVFEGSGVDPRTAADWFATEAARLVSRMELAPSACSKLL